MSAQIKIGRISSGNNGSWSHTVDPGINLALILLIGTHQGNPTAVSWNGNALTKLGSGRSSFNEDGDIWILINPAPGTGTVTVTTDGGSWLGGVAVNLSFVKQVNPASITVATNNGSGSQASVSITPPSSDNLLLAAVGSEAAPTQGSGLSSLVMLQGQSFENAGSEFLQQNAALPITMTFNLSSGQRWGMCAVAIEPEYSQDFENNNRYVRVGDGMSRNESAT